LRLVSLSSSSTRVASAHSILGGVAYPRTLPAILVVPSALRSASRALRHASRHAAPGSPVSAARTAVRAAVQTTPPHVHTTTPPPTRRPGQQQQQGGGCAPPAATPAPNLGAEPVVVAEHGGAYDDEGGQGALALADARGRVASQGSGSLWETTGAGSWEPPTCSEFASPRAAWSMIKG
jgi:hypothetical protein